LRVDELCRGGESGAKSCEDSTSVTCQTCATPWEPEDTSVPGRCPKCGGLFIVVDRCEGCPLDEMDWVRSHCWAGYLLERVISLEFDCDKFQVPWNQVTAEERWGLQILVEERAKKQKEDHEDREREAEVARKTRK
jgi:predicted RNA-binding Zn-ribbon protein involved in translation (DUF1610 family)